MTEQQRNSSCSCGDTTFDLSGKPLFRAFCHCTICQAYHGRPFADFCFFRKSDMVMPEREKSVYKSHKFPPILMRGKCVKCTGTTIEYFRFPLNGYVIVPTYNIGGEDLIPAPSFHMFYDTRVADIEDQLPKYSGFFISQLGFSKTFLFGA